MSILSLLGLAKLVQNLSSLTAVSTNRQILKAKAGKKEVVIQMHDLGEWQTRLKAHPLWKTEGKTSCPQPDQNLR